MTMRRMIGMTAAMAAMAMLPAHTAYARESGIQRTPDGARVLVSKDVGGQRYAITLNVADGTASGNVFGNDGSAPAFISCAPTGTSSFSCRVAPTCDPNAGRESGIQRAFDSEAVLVSKDVQGQRYAITQNTDGTLTGNVFFSATGAAKFLFCTPAGGAYTCALSDSCATLPCTSQYTTLQDPITLPATFFTLPESCRTYGDPIAVTLPRDFFLPDAEIMAAAARTAIVENPYRTTQVATAEQLAKNAQINDPILGSRVVNGPPKVGDVITCPTAGMQTLVSCTVDASGAFSSIRFDNCTVGSNDTGFIVQNGTVEVITNPPVCVLYTAGDLPLGVAAREQHRNFETSFFTGPGVRTEFDLENVGADVLYGNQCPGVDPGFTSRVYSGILGTNRTTIIDVGTGDERSVAYQYDQATISRTYSDDCTTRTTTIDTTRISATGEIGTIDGRTGESYSTRFGDARFALSGPNDATVLSIDGALTDVCNDLTSFVNRAYAYRTITPASFDRAGDGCPRGGAFELSAEGVVIGQMSFTDGGGLTLTPVSGAPFTVASCNDPVLRLPGTCAANDF